MPAPAAGGGWEPSADDVARVDAQLGRWRQGDVARPGFSVHVGNVTVPLVVEDRNPPDGDPDAGDLRAVLSDVEAVAVISQTCDVIRSSAKRPFVKVSPVVRLTGDALANACSGRIPRYAPLPGIGNDAFADLDRCTTITKAVLAGMDQERGCPDDNTIGAFANAVARHHGRFAFPDFVERILDPLSKRMARRAGKDSAEGRSVDALVEIRVAAKPEWESQHPITIELTFIVDEAHLRPTGDDEAEVSGTVAAFIAEGRTPEDVAAKLEGEGLSGADRSALWIALSQAWTALATTDGEPRVAAIVGDAESEATYPLSKVNATVRLDLNHLSDT